MTAEIKAASEQTTYSVMPYKRGGKFVCYITKIGYNAKGEEGERVRAWQYHGKDFAQAQKAALELADKWEAIFAKYKRARTLHNFWVNQSIASAKLDGYYLDEQDEKVSLVTEKEVAAYREVLNAGAPRLPVWQDAPASPAATSDQTSPPVSGKKTITLTEAKERYLKDCQERVGKLGKRGLKRKTYLNDSRALEVTIKGNGKGEGKPIASDIQVGAITRQTVQALVNWWHDPAREISERTAANYLRVFKKFLDELGRMEVGYGKPDIADLFSFTNPIGKIVKYDAKVVTSLLRESNDSTRLYQLLAMNCGFYQVDIAHLRRDEIEERDGETFIVRKRDKTSHQNVFKTEWWLFPETAKLLKAQQQKSGTFALLRPDGSGLYSRGKTSEDYMTTQFNKARASAEVSDFSFKQFRKIGVTAIKKLTGLPDVARQYAAQVVNGSLKNYDADDFFEPLTNALKKWHSELTKDGVFRTEKEPATMKRK